MSQIPRNGGHFYWRQTYNALSAGCTMLYGAMFDEMDEGDADSSWRARPPNCPPKAALSP